MWERHIVCHTIIWEKQRSTKDGLKSEMKEREREKERKR